jgi:hypothetical protein
MSIADIINNSSSKRTKKLLTTREADLIER